MDQLSQRSSSERTQFMSREDLDQEGSLDLDHDHYHYQDQDQDQYTDQEEDQRQIPSRTLELKVHDESIDFKCTVDFNLRSNFHSFKAFYLATTNQSAEHHIYKKNN